MPASLLLLSTPLPPLVVSVQFAMLHHGLHDQVSASVQSASTSRLFCHAFPISSSSLCWVACCNSPSAACASLSVYAIAARLAWPSASVALVLPYPPAALDAGLLCVPPVGLAWLQCPSEHQAWPCQSTSKHKHALPLHSSRQSRAGTSVAHGYHSSRQLIHRR